jgi:carbamoylphosphate synthase large subunit
MAGPEPSQPIKVLMLSIGSLVGHNLMQALAGRREQVWIVATNTIPEAANNFAADVAYRVPPAEREQEYGEAIERIIAAEKPDIVIPTRDDDVLALARLKPRYTGGAVLLVGSLAAAEIMNDKKRTAEFAEQQGLPFAPTADALDEARRFGAKFGYPLIAKPRSGNGSRGVRIVRSEAELERALAVRGDLVVQPFLDLPPEAAELLAPFDAGLPFFFSFPERGVYYAQMVIGPDGHCPEPYVITAVLVGGQSVGNHKVEDRRLIELGQRYAAAVRDQGWVGPINMQAKRMPDGSYVPFELNARLSGGTAARAQMGHDDIGIAIRMFLPGAHFPPLSNEPTSQVQKLPTTLPIPTAALEQLKQTGRWQRDS